MSKEEMDAILEKPLLDYKDIMKFFGISTDTAYKWIAEIQGYAKEKGYPPSWVKKVRTADFKEFLRIE